MIMTQEMSFFITNEIESFFIIGLMIKYSVWVVIQSLSAAVRVKM